MNRTKEKIHHPIQSSKIIKMLINQEILLEISNGQSIKEGVMFYKFNESGYKQRWFRLCSNILFVYHTDMNPTNHHHHHGQNRMMKPSFAFLMENFHIHIDSNMPNKFSFYFLAEPDVNYCFFCLNSRQTNEWLELLKQLSYRKQRVYLNQLRLQLKTITGIDPLESTPWSNKS
ncbi:pleckstrin homology domain-containing family J member 1-like [Dermatophagoides farinae]|uniref:pleckstrin homology domain-containing family J member 1-like n=1 Tax=Dermatophagoides farinae TaxID=6954 RepID=UPI001F0E42DD|nr:pleckstrin homology domain-containing family J member 1-like [Dermatophagoides farinae]